MKYVNRFTASIQRRSSFWAIVDVFTNKYTSILRFVGHKTNKGRNVSLTVNTSYRFSGLGISYIDGYQCQRNGIRVNTIVTPTVQGLREGHDEVLESITNCVTPLYLADKGTDQLEVMPNPASALLNIRFSTTSNTMVHLTVSDILGSVKLSQQQRTEAGKNNWQVPLTNLVPGVYFLKITASDGSNHTLKFIKE